MLFFCLFFWEVFINASSHGHTSERERLEEEASQIVGKKIYIIIVTLNIHPYVHEESLQYQKLMPL